MRVFVFLWEFGIFIIKEEHNFLDTMILQQNYSIFLKYCAYQEPRHSLSTEKGEQQGAPTGEEKMDISDCKTRSLKHYNENSHSNITKATSCLGFGFGLFLQHHTRIWLTINKIIILFIGCFMSAKTFHMDRLYWKIRILWMTSTLVQISADLYEYLTLDKFLNWVSVTSCVQEGKNFQKRFQ